ncbi:MAG: 7TM diverse intracellular signaling domain-containing protein [Cyclobacteriaceae bacterium]
MRIRSGAIAAVMMLLLCGFTDPAQGQTVREGVLDLGQWPEGKEMIVLNGLWQFYPQVSHPLQADTAAYTMIEASGTWPGEGPGPRFGYGLYRLRVVNCRTADLAIRLSYIDMAYELFIDGRSYAQVGTPTTGPEGHEPELKVTVVDFAVPSPCFTIDLFVSNYAHRRGGITVPLTLGRAEAVYAERERSLVMESYLLMIMLMVGLYAFLAYLGDSTFKEYLYFSLFCLFASLCILVINEIPVKVIWPDISFRLMSVMQYTGFILPAGFISLYLKIIHPAPFINKLTRIYFYISLGFAALVVLLPVWTYSYLALVFQVLTLIAALIFFVSTARRLRHSDKLTYLLLAGAVVLIGSFVHDVLAVAGFFIMDFWQVHGFAFYSVIQIIYFGIRHRELNERVRDMKQSLDSMGALRTQRVTMDKELIRELKSIDEVTEGHKVKEVLRKLESTSLVPAEQKLLLDNLENTGYEFMMRLEKKHPDLTRAEKEMCIALKAGFSNKEIANLRHISPDSVKKARTRLRKKLDLQQADYLKGYLDTI